MRGHAELLESDKSQALQTLLYGYNDLMQQRHIPGIVDNLMNRTEAEAPSRDYGLQPKYRQNYTRAKR